MNVFYCTYSIQFEKIILREQSSIVSIDHQYLQLNADLNSNLDAKYDIIVPDGRWYGLPTLTLKLLNC